MQIECYIGILDGQKNNSPSISFYRNWQFFIQTALALSTCPEITSTAQAK
jgi:hypothetical protein